MVTQQQPPPPVAVGTRSIAERITQPSGKFAFVAAAIYGRGGVGKTTLLATMPGRGLIIDVPQVEGGTMVLAGEAGRIDIFPVTSWDDLGEAYKFLRDSSHDYKWYSIDTTTATQELAKRKALRERDLSADPHIVTIQDWGKIGELQGELFYRFRMLPMHGIFLAQERLRGSGEDGAMEYQPDISPAALSKLTPSMFLVGRLFTREIEDPETKQFVIERRLRVGPHMHTVTKVRAVPERPMPAVVREPHLGQILAWLIGAKSAKPPQSVAVDDDGLFEATG